MCWFKAWRSYSWPKCLSWTFSGESGLDKKSPIIAGELHASFEKPWLLNWDTYAAFYILDLLSSSWGVKRLIFKAQQPWSFEQSYSVEWSWIINQSASYSCYNKQLCCCIGGIWCINSFLLKIAFSVTTSCSCRHPQTWTLTSSWSCKGKSLQILGLEKNNNVSIRIPCDHLCQQKEPRLFQTPPSSELALEEGQDSARSGAGAFTRRCSGCSNTSAFGEG